MLKVSVYVHITDCNQTDKNIQFTTDSELERQLQLLDTYAHVSTNFPLYESILISHKAY